MTQKKNRDVASVIIAETSKKETGKVSTNGSQSANAMSDGESNNIYTRAIARMKSSLCPDLVELEARLKALNAERAELLARIDDQKDNLQAFTLDDFTSQDTDNEEALKNYYQSAQEFTKDFTLYVGTSEDSDKIESAKQTVTIGAKTFYLFECSDKVRALNSYNGYKKALQIESNKKRVQANKAKKVVDMLADLTPEQIAMIRAHLGE